MYKVQTVIVLAFGRPKPSSLCSHSFAWSTCWATLITTAQAMRTQMRSQRFPFKQEAAMVIVSGWPKLRCSAVAHFFLMAVCSTNLWHPQSPISSKLAQRGVAWLWRTNEDIEFIKCLLRPKQLPFVSASERSRLLSFCACGCFLSLTVFSYNIIVRTSGVLPSLLGEMAQMGKRNVKPVKYLSPIKWKI